MVFVKSSARIDVNRDNITSALFKKVNNDSLSKKTLAGLVEITNSTSKLSRNEAQNIFLKDIRIPYSEGSAEVVNQLTNILNWVNKPTLKQQIEKFIYNCNSITSDKNTATDSSPRASKQDGSDNISRENNASISTSVGKKKAEDNNKTPLSEKRYTGYEKDISSVLKNISPMEPGKLVELVKKRDDAHIQLREKQVQSRREHYRNEKLKTECRALKQKLSEYNPIIRNQELLYEATHGTGIHFKQEHIAPRRGEHCKLVSLSQLDAYFAERMGKHALPLLKEHHYGVSLRQMAKEEGSLQGEILQSTTLKKIAEKIGYSVEMVRPENLIEFKDCLKNNINDKGIIIFYALETDDLYDIYDDRFFANHNSVETFEHASVISWYDSEREICTLNHWQEKHPGIPVELLFKSNQSLKASRMKEFYSPSAQENHLYMDYKDPQTGKRLYKYRIEHTEQYWNVKERKNIEHLQTISPVPGTGFKGLVMLIEPDKNHPRWSQQQ
ncbi:hypothetical protein [Vagococcus sp. WN89Y]|uniref:hypothetical protein n=1 Tax=Vagococcus sp. WN89Y TaxID=3457258 RepID=UPI003FCC72A3